MKIAYFADGRQSVPGAGSRVTVLNSRSSQSACEAHVVAISACAALLTYSQRGWHGVRREPGCTGTEHKVLSIGLTEHSHEKNPWQDEATNATSLPASPTCTHSTWVSTGLRLCKPHCSHGKRNTLSANAPKSSLDVAHPLIGNVSDPHSSAIRFVSGTDKSAWYEIVLRGNQPPSVMDALGSLSRLLRIHSNTGTEQPKCYLAWNQSLLDTRDMTWPLVHPRKNPLGRPHSQRNRSKACRSLPGKQYIGLHPDLNTRQCRRIPVAKHCPPRKSS
eukprot:3941801-Rhodomonas_salina.5